MKTIETAYINALLADASYINVSERIDSERMKARLTEIQTTFLATNFTIKTSIETPNANNPSWEPGFDAVVWEGKAGTEYAGQLYVSMRGTQGGTDIADDITLASQGVPYDQIRDMVNWWMRISTPTGESAAQIQYGAVKTGVGEDGKDIFEDQFTLTAPVLGSGLVSNRIISGVNGHSLGGYLSTAFTRLFGSNVLGVSTYNSAGFSTLAASNIQTSYDQISQLVGVNLGKGGFGAVAPIQTNYYAQNGWSLTTNTWGEMGFMVPGFSQYGQRVGLNQEQGTGPTNHSMYHLTDLLALGTALEKLSPSLTVEQLNGFMAPASAQVKGSLEGVLDAVRRVVLGANVVATPVSDSADATERTTYHQNLKALTDSTTFKALAQSGKVTVSLANTGLASVAKGDFGAFLSLQALSPIVVGTGNDAAAAATLGALNPTLYTNWLSDKNARLYGDTSKQPTYSDNWYTDRAAMLQAIEAFVQKLGVVERFMGFTYGGTRGEARIAPLDATSGNVTVSLAATQVASITHAYERFKTDIYESLVLGTRLHGYIDKIALVIDNDTVKLDFAGVEAAFNQAIASNSQEGTIDLIEFVSAAGQVRLKSIGWDASAYLNAQLSSAPDLGGYANHIAGMNSMDAANDYLFIKTA